MLMNYSESGSFYHPEYIAMYKGGMQKTCFTVFLSANGLPVK